jgi:hypothetical protein
MTSFFQDHDSGPGEKAKIVLNPLERQRLEFRAHGVADVEEAVLAVDGVQDLIGHEVVLLKDREFLFSLGMESTASGSESTLHTTK